MDLDLTAAIEHAWAAVFANHDYDDGDDANNVRNDVAYGIEVALPYILDALAEKAEADPRLGYMAFGGTWMNPAATYLRALAEEARA